MAMLNALLPDPIDTIRRGYHFVVQRYMMMIQFTVFRSGYTGEDGRGDHPKQCRGQRWR